jgi:hypothetical protein
MLISMIDKVNMIHNYCIVRCADMKLSGGISMSLACELVPFIVQVLAQTNARINTEARKKEVRAHASLIFRKGVL